MKRRILIFLTVFLALPVGAQSLRNNDPRTAAHVGEVHTDRVVWESSFSANNLSTNEDDARLDFASSLPSGAQIEISGDTATRLEVRRDLGERIVGVSLAGATGAPRLRTTISLPAPSIDPPFAVFAAQRVEIRGARFVAGAGSPIAMGLFESRDHSVDVVQARAIDAVHGEPGGRAIYLTPDAAFLESGGLTPFLEYESNVHRLAFAALGLVLGMVLLLLAAVMRSIRRSARAEAAEAFLAEHEELLAEDFARVG